MEDCIPKNNLSKEKPADQYPCKCLNGCEVSFQKISSLIGHLKSQHEEELGTLPPMIYIEFLSSEDFIQWLQTEEANNNVRYIVSSTSKNEHRCVSYYKCNRSSAVNYLKNPPVLRKRALKAQGYSKMSNAACTSYIKVTIDTITRKCDVEYYSYHYGHSIDIQHLRIDKHCRNQVTLKLAQGMPTSEILDDIRNTAGDETRLRSHLITKKDVLNIKAAVKRKPYKAIPNSVIGNESSAKNMKTLKINTNVITESLSDERLSIDSLQKGVIAEAASIAFATKFVKNVDILRLALKQLKELYSILNLKQMGTTVKESPLLLKEASYEMIKKKPSSPQMITHQHKSVEEILTLSRQNYNKGVQNAPTFASHRTGKAHRLKYSIRRKTVNEYNEINTKEINNL